MENIPTKDLIKELKSRGFQHLETQHKGRYKCTFEIEPHLYKKNSGEFLEFNSWDTYNLNTTNVLKDLCLKLRSLIISGQNTKGKLTILVFKDYEEI